jgi:ferredoxin-thioredoxin reductase catalytic chain
MDEVEYEARAKALMDRLAREAEAGGYNLNPETEMTLELCRGLVSNIDRYGYMSCPCRLAEGDKLADLDIVCPCDYRDLDLEEYETCYCSLYVSDAIKRGEAEAKPVPERRPPAEERAQAIATKAAEGVQVWRCRVCGYLCAREAPPDVCPICKAKKERFEPYSLG